MAMITSITMNFPFISTHYNYHNVSSNPYFYPLCSTKLSSSSVHLIWPISSNSLHLSSSSIYSKQLTASHNANRQTLFRKNHKVKVICGRSDPLKVMISGAPASGKGTQCELIVQKFGLVHISTGDLLRAELSAGTDIGNKAKEYMNSEKSAITSTQADMASLNKDWRGIPTRLNNIPHSREIREYFYTDVLQATQRAVNDGKTRLKIEISIPELNPSTDVYRIGTLMELIRVLVLSFADDGKRVKVCIQGSMGEGALAGMPLKLKGSRQILEYMDWGDYGALGTFVNIGSIGGKNVEKQDDLFLLASP